MNRPEARWYFPQEALLHMIGEIIQLMLYFTHIMEKIYFRKMI